MVTGGPLRHEVFDGPGQRRGVGKRHGVRQEGLDLQLGIDSLLQPAEEFQEELVSVEHGAVALLGLEDDDLQRFGGVQPHAVERPRRPARRDVPFPP